MTAPTPAAGAGGGSLEVVVARLLAVGTYASIALIAIGTVLLLATGQSPLDPSPTLVIADIPAQIRAGEPAGYLWLGILAMVATPALRVVVAMVGFWRLGERAMALVALLILAVVAVGVAVGVVAG